MTMPFDSFLEWLSREDLVVDSENDVALLAMLWVSANKNEVPDASRLRACIRTDLLGPAFSMHILPNQAWWLQGAAPACSTTSSASCPSPAASPAAAATGRGRTSPPHCHPLFTGRISLSNEQRAKLVLAEQALEAGGADAVLMQAQSAVAYVNGYGVQIVMAATGRSGNRGACISAGVVVTAMVSADSAVPVKIRAAVRLEGIDGSADAALAEQIDLCPEGAAGGGAFRAISSGTSVAAFSGCAVRQLIERGLLCVVVSILELDGC